MTSLSSLLTLRVGGFMLIDILVLVKALFVVIGVIIGVQKLPESVQDRLVMLGGVKANSWRSVSPWHS